MEEGCSAVSLGGGMVVTADHCVDDLPLGSDTSVGYLIFRGAPKDYALLFDTSRIDDAKTVMRDPRSGEHVYAIGYPQQLATDSQELTITDGLVAGPRNAAGEFRVTAPIYYGSSGGGLWGEDGALLGLTVNGFLSMPGQNFVVPCSDFVPHLPRDRT